MPEAHSSNENVPILVLDDERNILESIKRMLHNTEFDCDITNSVPGALQLIKKKNYSIILFDYLMPVMSGLTFVAQTFGRNSNLKMILITAYAEKNIIDEFFKHGVVAYLLKPFDKEQLLATLRHHK